MSELGYLRFPTLHKDTVVFACEDDLWVAPTTGGRAFRLTAGVAEASHPRFSLDGEHLAFVGRDDGAPDVYVIPAQGGSPLRLSFHAAPCTVSGFSPKGEILFASDAESPLRRDIRLFAVPLAGGAARRLPFGPASAIAYGPSGPGGSEQPLVLGRYTAEPARWKRYRGGTCGELWIDPTGGGEFRRLVTNLGNLAAPCWVQGRVYFISDHEGVGNVYSCTPEGQDLRRHTDHEKFYARSLSSDGERLVYHAGAELYLIDPQTNTSRPLEVRLVSSYTQRSRRFVPAAQYLESASLSPDGAGLALVTRGKAYTFSHWEGPVLQHGAPDGVRYRLLRWLDSKRLIAVMGDEKERERLVIFSLDGSESPRVLEDLDLGRVLDIEISPRGDQLALSNHRNELFWLDLAPETPKLTLLDKSPFARVSGLAWSADGRWLAYGFATSPRTTAIKLYQIEKQESFLATRPLLHDYAPSFDPSGRYLYFLGQRDFDPVYDGLQFDLGFPKGTRPFAITLRRDLPSPFLPQPKAPTPKEDDQKHSAKAPPADSLPPVEIDREGIEARVVAFPVPEGKYGQIEGIGEKVLFSSFPVEGSLDQNWADFTPPAKGTLEVYDLEEQRHERLWEGISGFQVGRDRKTLLVRVRDRLRVLPAGEKPPEPKEKGENEPGRRSGWVDLERVKVSIRPEAEWRQMFREAWRLQREHFWTEDMSGIDWDAVYQRYRPLVERVTTRSELSDLLWELQGELGTSHAYEFGGDYRQGPQYRQGFLGADWGQDEGSGQYHVLHLVAGDSWDQGADSPLRAPGVNVQEGDVLLAVNGLPVGGARSPGEALVNLAGQEVLLTVRRKEEAPRTVRVKTLPQERQARYREWVDHNRQAVHQATEGRVGYIHIPDMGAHGYAEFHRAFLVEHDREGLIIDVRYNGGGHVSGLLLQKLARRRLGYNFTRWGAPSSYPDEAPRGPLVALTNEQAGSDGDIFSHAFRQMKLGPLIGKRTWGGVIGIWPRHSLADGTITTQPEYAFYFDDVGWKVENYGAEPDIEIDYPPHAYLRGVDPQLNKAIEVAGTLLVERPAHSPKPSERPRLAAPPLAPRPAHQGKASTEKPGK